MFVSWNYRAPIRVFHNISALAMGNAERRDVPVLVVPIRLLDMRADQVRVHAPVHRAIDGHGATTEFIPMVQP